MCGIAGIVGHAADREAVVRGMTDALRHRGPDGEGFWHDEKCSLGHRRLSVIDLSSAGAQPMANEDGTVQVVYNGEIYNYRDLRRRLEAAGHTFRSHTDTEVLVHLYEDHGADLVQHIRGMFAFAIWDTRRERLLLARDRFGQKPLFYSLAGGAFSFASELKGLLANPAIAREPDPVAVDQFLALHFIPSPSTIWRDAHRLPPASILVKDVGSPPRIERYWSQDGIHPRSISFEDACAEVDRHLTRAVREQLVSDVPVGVFLSGGIDSTLIVSKAAVESPGIATFSIGYDESEFSELKYASVVAERFRTRHHATVLRPEDARHPESLIELFDEPFADVAAIPQVHLAKQARRTVTVALTGDGGDELFGGYQHHVLGYWLQRLQPGMRLGGLAARAALPMIPRTGGRGIVRAVRRGLEAAAEGDWSSAVLHLRATLPAEQRERLYAPEFRARLEDDPYAGLQPDAPRDGAAPIERLFRVAGDRVLADQFMYKADMASMSVGLECRSPFLDLPLAELVASFPPGLKIRWLKGKRILRRLLQGKIDQDIVRRPKMGLSMPIEEWIKHDLAPMISDTVLARDARTQAYVRRAEAMRLFDEHRRGKANHRRILWALLLLELWLRRHLRG